MWNLNVDGQTPYYDCLVIIPHPSYKQEVLVAHFNSRKNIFTSKDGGIGYEPKVWMYYQEVPGD